MQSRITQGFHQFTFQLPKWCLMLERAIAKRSNRKVISLFNRILSSPKRLTANCQTVKMRYLYRSLPPLAGWLGARE
ncbi:hypothetical protein [Coleofasciculus sp. F4-SAH-05]|uniref:hypothetical protein n=1 Tax=Coleofasciculus sp. F4-SAH-05 TaxID=3069525 RepID=UPI003300D959